MTAEDARRVLIREAEEGRWFAVAWNGAAPPSIGHGLSAAAAFADLAEKEHWLLESHELIEGDRA